MPAIDLEVADGRRRMLAIERGVAGRPPPSGPSFGGRVPLVLVPEDRVRQFLIDGGI
jgi:hypothetical protein